MDFTFVPVAGLDQFFQVKSIVFVLIEYRLAIIALYDDVLGLTGKN